MDRRHFLIKGASFLVGTLCGVSGFSKVLACGSGGLQEGVQRRIALIIDDIGFSLGRARQFLDLNVPITYAVLPKVVHSQYLAGEIHDCGHEIMLHQPMEPYDHEVDPGPGALYVGDKSEKIMKVMAENISEIPFATGVNNHMGSRFTSCPKEMGEVLQVVKENNLFFVDSLTSSRSMAYETARRLNVTAACRNIFLDTQIDEAAILRQLFRLRMQAVRYGRAIGIGHPFPETARAVGRFVKALKDPQISLVYISDLLVYEEDQQVLSRYPEKTTRTAFL
ncbi:MAG: divergent polysaccharide deacetylase family protein [Desulfatiglandales bacterium]